MSVNPVVRLRAGRGDDAVAIQHLYETVAGASGGIARTAAEVTRDYVDEFVAHSLARGFLVVAEQSGMTGLAGELHAYRSDLRNCTKASASSGKGDLRVGFAIRLVVWKRISPWRGIGLREFIGTN